MDVFDRTTRGAHVDVSLLGVARGRRGRALAEALRMAILAGSLAPRTTLPSSRRLADDLGVSRGVIVEAYAQLVAEGHLVAAHGSGTQVADRQSPPQPPAAIAVRQIAGDNPGQPDPMLFPRRDWLRSMAAASAQLPDAAFNYGDVRGTLELRGALIAYLGRVRSIVAEADQVLVLCGFAQTLACVAQMLMRRHGSATIIVEDPGSSGVVEQLQWWGVRVVRVPVDESGLDITRLGRRRAHAVVVTPAHQYPTGVTLSAERRHALVAWAARTGAYIIEDDYDAEYRYDRQPLTSLHALAPDSVLAAGSISKSLSPALRLGWLVAPAPLVPELAAIKANSDLGTATLPQAALAHFIMSGSLDRHLRRSRTKYRQRRDALVAVLRDLAPTAELSGVSAGLHLLVHLDEAVDERGIADTARTLGFAAQPLSRYRGAPGRPGLVLGYGALSVDRVRSAATELAAHLNRPRL